MLLKSYQDLSSVIVTLQIKGRLEADESRALLDILDLLVRKGDDSTLRVLDQYLGVPTAAETEEIDEIVKASLTGCNWRDQASRQGVIEVIKELTAEKIRITDKGSAT
jgi:hypothetical protein